MVYPSASQGEPRPGNSRLVEEVVLHLSDQRVGRHVEHIGNVVVSYPYELIVHRVGNRVGLSIIKIIVETTTKGLPTAIVRVPIHKPKSIVIMSVILLVVVEPVFIENTHQMKNFINEKNGRKIVLNFISDVGKRIIYDLWNGIFFRVQDGPQGYPAIISLFIKNAQKVTRTFINDGDFVQLHFCVVLITTFVQRFPKGFVGNRTVT
mmetsp:Transcript_32/g.34  ORF Transcript_32/g.34 Transcript_32/m.34 type:complete len:207 (-) Transcript_32:209-829(-)